MALLIGFAILGCIIIGIIMLDKAAAKLHPPEPKGVYAPSILGDSAAMPNLDRDGELIDWSIYCTCGLNDKVERYSTAMSIVGPHSAGRHDVEVPGKVIE